MDRHTTRRDSGRHFGPSARLASADDSKPAVGSIALLERSHPDRSGRGRAAALAPVRSAPVSCGAAVSAAVSAAVLAAAPAILPSRVPDSSTPSTVPRRIPDAPEPAPSGEPRRPSRRTARPAARRPPARIVEVRPVVVVNCPDPAPEGPGYRMGRWSRLAVTLTVVATVVIAAVTLIGRGGHDRSAFVTVEPGDTLWSVASRSVPDRDPRDVVADVIALNGLRSGDVHVGEVLRVPVG